MNKKKIVILGVGLVGSAIAKDLSNDSDVVLTVSDISEKSLEKLSTIKHIKLVHGNVLDFNFLRRLLRDKDIVVSAVPGFIGFEVLKFIIEIGKTVVDISFMPEDVYELNHIAKKKNIAVFFDCGVAPGMSNMLVSKGYNFLDEAHSAEIYVGGLPLLRELPYEYKAVFSPSDVIEEYTRPVFSVENGVVKEKNALSDLENIFFDKIGTLEAFNTDGLRSLVRNINIPNMKEKTLRYPGHVEKINLLKKTGFFSKNVIKINGTEIRPIDFTSKLLFPIWELKSRERDLTIMKISVAGLKNEKEASYECFLYDEYDEKTKIHSMARTTGYTATSVVRLIKKEKLSNMFGIISPEEIGGKQDFIEIIFGELSKKGIIYSEKYL